MTLPPPLLLLAISKWIVYILFLQKSSAYLMSFSGIGTYVTLYQIRWQHKNIFLAEIFNCGDVHVAQCDYYIKW